MKKNLRLGIEIIYLLLQNTFIPLPSYKFTFTRIQLDSPVKLVNNYECKFNYLQSTVHITSIKKKQAFDTKTVLK
jgi:hypothetical protein